MPQDAADVTQLLLAWSRGDRQALERLLPLVLEELKRIARRHLQREGREHTLQPTALINELYLKLVDRRTVDLKNRAQFFGVAADMMRNILVDHARNRQAAKRGRDVISVPLEEGHAVAEIRSVELIALDDALKALAKSDPRQAKIVELRYFAGLTHEEVADLLGVSVPTVKRDWHTARVWLFRQISQSPGRNQD